MIENSTLSNTRQKLIKKVGLTLALSLAVYIGIYLTMVAVDSDYLTVAAPASSQSQSLLSDFPAPDYAAITVAEHKQAEADRLAAEQAAREQIRQSKINLVANYLRSKSSPMTPYAYAIVDAAARCGGNYKILLAIAEVESGLGRAPYKKFNPYGYLNGVQYRGWAEALDSLSCAISQQYIAVYGTNFPAMAKRYAASPTWAARVSKVYYSL